VTADENLHAKNVAIFRNFSQRFDKFHFD